MTKKALWMGLLGLLAFLGFTLPILVRNEWDPSAFIKFPEESESFIQYGESLLGEVVGAPGAGHDGKFFFIQAVDPFFTEPENNAALLDVPMYRAQRMLYPTVAGGLGAFSPPVVAWSLYVLNGIVVFLGTLVTAIVAQRLGGPVLLGLSFALNPGVLAAAAVDSADALALLFVIVAIERLLAGKVSMAVGAFTLAALTRESMIAGFFGFVIYRLVRKEGIDWRFGLPVAAPLAWYGFLLLRIGHLPDNVVLPPVIRPPFVGFLKAMEVWLSEPEQLAHLVIGIVLMTLSIVLVIKVFSGGMVAFIGAGFALVAFFMSEFVWLHYFDSARALAPLVTLYALTIPKKTAKMVTRPVATGVG